MWPGNLLGDERLWIDVVDPELLFRWNLPSNSIVELGESDEMSIPAEGMMLTFLMLLSVMLSSMWLALTAAVVVVVVVVVVAVVVAPGSSSTSL